MAALNNNALKLHLLPPKIEVAASGYSNRRRKVLTELQEREGVIWFTEHAHTFHRLGLYVIQHRAEFVEGFFGWLDRWMASPLKDGEGRVVESRIRMVNGVGYASWMAMVSLLESHGAADVTAFRKFMDAHVVNSSDEVKDEVNVNVFWQELTTAWSADALDLSLFKQVAEERPHPPDAPAQALDEFGQTQPWTNHLLYFDPDGVIASIKMHMVRQREGMSLSRGDYQAQMSKQDYWVPGKHRQRFGSGAATKACWCVDLDQHPLGYHPISDDAYRAWRALGPDARKLAGDPRKGPLYAIIHKLLVKARKPKTPEDEEEE